MDNQTKQYLAGLESRVMRLENALEGFGMALQQASGFTFNCNQCGAYDPIKTGYICSNENCCQGLNPNDEE